MAMAMPITTTRRRTSSTRFSSPPTMSRLPSSIDSHRTFLPKDTTAFTFKLEFVEIWCMPNDLWAALPSEMHKVLTHMQHAGAAVLTSHERLVKLDAKRIAPSSTSVFEHATASDAIAAKLYEHEARTLRGRSSTKDREEYDLCPVPKEWRHLDSFSSSQTPQSSGRSASSNSSDRDPQSEVMSPISPQQSFSPPLIPLELGPSLDQNLSRRGSETMTPGLGTVSSRRGSHTIIKEMPRDPANQMYYAELEHLRKEALVRLRHAYRAVSMEWDRAMKASPTLNVSDNLAAALEVKRRENQFEDWLGNTKIRISEWDEKIKELSAGVQFSLGWSDAPGIDNDALQVAI